ncbi:MAG: hypothetical protein RL398_2271 [Planctomycetota bacterium]
MRALHPVVWLALAMGFGLAGARGQGLLTANGQPDPAHPDLHAWYAAWQGVNGVSVPANGAPVTRWNDLSSHGHHLVRTNAGANRQPTFRLSVGSGPKVVDFDGDDYLWADASTEFGTLAGAKTVFFVCRVRSGDGGYVFDGTTSSGRNAVFTGQTSGPGRWHTYAGAAAPSGPFVDHHAFQLHAVQFGPTQLEHFLDGAAIYSGASTVAPLAGLVLGGRYSYSHEFNGEIAEVLFYSRALTTAERQSIEGYLRSRYPATAIPVPPATTDVFVGGVGYPAFRIPSLVTLQSGTMLAFAEGRQSLNDHSQNDMVLRRSLDGGTTWGPLQVLHDDGANSLNNPCAVQIRTGNHAGRVLLMYQRYPAGCHVNCVVPGFTGTNVSRSYVMWSDDDGLTWSAPLEITTQIKRATAKTLNGGPGIAIQKRRAPFAGRIVVPFNQLDTAGHWTNYAVFSDDGGVTWSYGDLADDSQTPGSGNEVQFVERTDGALLLNSRSHGGTKHRKTAISTDGGQTWSPMSEDPKLNEPEVMASVLRFSDPLDGDGNRILYAGPNSRLSRIHGTVQLSQDDGATWSEGKVVYRGSYAYSCLTAVDRRRIGLLFEADNYSVTRFTTLTVEWLSDRRDCLGNCAHGCAFGAGCVGSGGYTPTLLSVGCPSPGGSAMLLVGQGLGGSLGLVGIGVGNAPLPFPGCTLSIGPLLGTSPLAVLVGSGNGHGVTSYILQFPTNLPPVSLTAQGLILDPAAAAGFAATNPITLEVF